MCLRLLVPLYLILRLANAESQHVAWVVSTTTSPKDASTFFADDEVDAQTSTLESSDDTTTQPAIVYDPGTKLLSMEKGSQVTSNQVSGSECDDCGVQVQALKIRSDIQFRYAHTVLHSKISNLANTSNQATFSVILPESAFISKFFIDIDGKKYEAYVKKKNEAEKQYQDALESGQTAAHIGNSVRDADVFVVSVNVAPRSKVSFNLTYEELLSRRLSAYHHIINLIPDQVIKDMTVDVYIKEVRNITMLNVSTSDEGKNVHSGGDDLLVEYKSSTSAHVHFNPKEEDQLKKIRSGVQQLTIQYDVDRRTNPAGDVMLMDGYFVHYFAPEDVPPEPKHIVFVLDTSGSMWGRKLQQVQQAMFSILDSLRESDYFSIVQFSTNVLEWSTQPQEMVGLSKYKVTHPVNEMNIAKAKQFVKAMEASGGTNISGALRKALQLVAKQDYGSNSVEDIAEKRHLGQDAPQPMMIFLTDGIATVGELMTAKILAQVRAVNTEIRVAVFSLAFGDGANYRFLKKLSLQNNGFARKIYESADAALQLKSFYNEIASPLLANVSFTYLDNKVDKNSLTTNQFHSYYGGSEIIVAGKINSQDTDFFDLEDLGAQVTAWSGGDHKDVLYKPHFSSNKSKHQHKKPNNKAGTLERLWAYLTVRQLLDQHIAIGDDDKEISRPSVLLGEKFTELEDSSPKSRALQLSLQYGFVTPLTSLVVVVPRNGSTNEVSEIVRNPIGNSLLEPAHFEESAPIQNKILPASFLPRPPTLTSRPQTTQSTTSSTTLAEEVQVVDLTAMISLTNYSLDDVSWLTDRTDTEDRLVVENRNSSYLVTGLIPTSEVPDILEECVTPDGESGSCWIMSACVQSNFVDDYTTFVQFFCPIGRLAGVCCPMEFTSTGTTVTTTEVPSTTSGIR